jgi:competence protein ComEC
LLLWASERFDQWLFPRALVTRRIYEPSMTSTVLGVCRKSFSGAVLCWLAALPLIAATTGSVSLLGAIATTLLSPLFALLLVAGLLVLAIGLAVPGVGVWASGVLAEGARASAGIAVWLDALPGGSLTLPFGGKAAWVWCWSATASVMSFLWLRVVRPIWRTPRDADPRPRRLLGWFGVVCAVVALGVPMARVWRGQRLAPGVAGRVDMLDAGDGSCFLLRAGGDALLWDAREPSGWWSGRSGIASSLRALGVTSVPRVVLTHPDADHADGLLDALRPLGVREVLVPARFLEQAGLDPKGLAGGILQACRERGVRVSAVLTGDALWLGNMRGTVLSPPEFVDVGQAWALDNDHSVVVLWEVPRAGNPDRPGSILMTGDASASAIARLTGMNIPTPDVMELPHHGSAIAPSVAWVDGLSPGVVLQSTGPSRVDLPAWRGVRARTDWVCTAETGWGYAELTGGGLVRVVRARKRD